MPDSNSGNPSFSNYHRPSSLFEHQNSSSSSLTSTHHRRNPSQPIFPTYSPSQNLQNLLSEGGTNSNSSFSASFSNHHQRSDSSRSASELLRGPFSERASPNLGNTILFENDDEDKESFIPSSPGGTGVIGSPPIGSGPNLRRHQSLNQARGGSNSNVTGGSIGRASFQRQLSSRSSDLLLRENARNNVSPGRTSPFSSRANVGGEVRTGNNSNNNSPLTPSSFSSAPWNREPAQSTSQSIGNSSSAQQPTPGISVASPSPAKERERVKHGYSLSLSGNGNDNANSLMNIHANLAKMDIRSDSTSWAVRNRASTHDSTSTGQDPFEDSSLTAGRYSQQTTPNLSTSQVRPGRSSTPSDLPTTPSSGRKLPSLITNREVLARGALANTGGGSLAGPASAAAFVPEIGHAHRRNDSEGNFINLRNSLAGSGNGMGGGNHRLSQAVNRVGNASSRADLAALMGPFSATPAPGWGSDLHAQLLSRGDDSNGGSNLAGIGESFTSPISARLQSQWGLSLGVGSPVQELQTGTPASAISMNALALSHALQQQQLELQLQSQRTAALQAQLARTGVLNDGGLGINGDLSSLLYNQQTLEGQNYPAFNGNGNGNFGGMLNNQSQNPNLPQFLPQQNLNPSDLNSILQSQIPLLPNFVPLQQNSNLNGSQTQQTDPNLLGFNSPPPPPPGRTNSAMGNRNQQSSQGPRREAQQLDPEIERLVQVKGYNPPASQFDTAPQNARFFVIKR